MLTALANRLKPVCFNFPFAYFTQLFFIQPTVRSIFKVLFRKDIEEQAKINSKHTTPKSEVEAVENIYKRIEEIKKELKEELENELK